MHLHRHLQDLSWIKAGKDAPGMYIEVTGFL